MSQSPKAPTNMIENSSAIHSPGVLRLASLLLIALAAVLYFSRLGATPLRVNAEIRTFEITNNMLLRKDFIVPVFRGETRYNKPPLYYWSSIATSRLLRRFDLGVHRIPSAIAALGVLALGVAWGRLLGKERESLLGLNILAITYLFVVQARRGSFEQMLSFFCNASLLAFYLSWVRRSRCWAMVGAIAFGLAFLTKGTPALPYVPLVLAVWLGLQGQLKKLWRKELLIVTLVGSAIAVSWYVYILLFRPDSRSDILGELLLPLGVKATQQTTAEHKEPFYFYFLTIWRAGYPLSLFLPLTVAYVVRHRLFPPQSVQRLLVLTVLVPFLIFSAIPMKQDHYLLPGFLPLALLTGWAIHEVAQGLINLSRKWVTVPLVLGAVLLLLSAIATAVGTYMIFDTVAGALAVAILLAAGGGSTLWLVRRGRLHLAPHILALTTGVLFGWYFIWVRPIEDGFGSGSLLLAKDYNAAYWNAKFERYPILKRLLDVERGERIVQKSRAKMRFEDTSGTLTTSGDDNEASTR
jgi:4-amino-4-deoxy-L-arabinose transferase-like glycosyltransferase